MPIRLPWHTIDTVLLDMDGTLIDLHFDSHLWQTLVPERYAVRHALPLDEARRRIEQHYGAVAGTLNWYCVDYWSETLGLDIRALSRELREKIRWRANVIPFLAALKRAGKRRILFTNAHPASLEVKVAELGLDAHLDAMVSSHQLGWAKESPQSWQALSQREPFDPARTLFIDDSERILAASAEFGVAHQLGIARPDSQQPPLRFARFAALNDYADLLPLAG
ncbi:GMP/IMP nucleotidase [Aeromonas simiae]|uniref:GMP/IMP nucleotidase n=1 Tax=Aeromonas simiae TaxID=218936 RepID=A0A5J6X1X8_9GAMM|nr:GMP/IMP nucleotidase [Aeromonas simiae]QFI56113.1 GMP/IMP nucleotidase [Aeromonas simiae]